MSKTMKILFIVGMVSFGSGSLGWAGWFVLRSPAPPPPPPPAYKFNVNTNSMYFAGGFPT